MAKYNLAIIGSGPCGYVAAIRAAQLGLKVILFEKNKIGGVCLNEGCIPTKVLLASAEMIQNIERAREFGIDIKDYKIDFLKIAERKENIVKKLTSGVEVLIKARRIELVKESVRVSTIDAENILIATGSLPLELPNIKFDGKRVLSSSDALNLEKVPRSILIIGGGVIGCEFASIFNAYGADVTIVEMMEQILPTEDKEVAKKMEGIFKKRGIKILTKTKVEKVDRASDNLEAHLSNGSSIACEKVLLCVGRKPNAKDVGIEEIGIECDSRGWIKVERSFRTNIKNIYAAGDIIGGTLLAHLASREGICAVEGICGKKVELDYNVVPNCIYTHPEIASVGLSEAKAKEKAIEVITRKFLFSAIGKTHVIGGIEGFVKLVVDSENDKILGAQIIGPHATDLIAELTLSVQFGITSEKLASVIHAHPTLSEAIYEASEAVHNRAIHSL